MANASTPSEIARETLRQLAMRRVPPTPDNYQALYHEISGSPAEESFPEKSLKALVQQLPHDTAEQMRHTRSLDSAIADKSWARLGEALAEIFTKGGETQGLAALLREVLIQLDTRNAGLTPARKREALDHVLRISATPELLYQRLQGLVSSWAQAPVLADDASPESTAEENTAEPGVAAVVSTPASPSMAGDLLELMAKLLEDAVTPLLTDAPDLSKECAQLATTIRSVRNPRQAGDLASKLKRFSFRLNFVAEDQAELRSALLHLLHLIVENIGELVVDDQWLHGQIAAVNNLVNQPLNIRTLDDVERRLKDVIYKQSTLKHHLVEAQQRIKDMLASFVDRLAEFSVSTGDYHDKVEKFSQRLSKARDITDLSDVLGDVLSETRTIQSAAARTRDELNDMRHRVEEAEQEIDRLHTELAQTSEMVRIDALTGVLNRKGLGEALEREVGRVRRHNSMLCVSLLDIDNFKRINDDLGHATGDAALIHLAKVTQQSLRPQDTLARYGGEEFVILLPDTELNDAIGVMTRVQRELTRNFFLHESEKLLITFSAGVAEMQDAETPEHAIERADQAMYLAKRAGKNKVFAA